MAVKAWADYVKDNRKRRGLTVQQLALRSGLSEVSIYRWEHGKKPREDCKEVLKAFFKANDPGPSAEDIARKAGRELGFREGMYEAHALWVQLIKKMPLKKATKTHFEKEARWLIGLRIGEGGDMDVK